MLLADLRRQRLLRGMKQSHLAELLGVDQATVSRWERRRQRPSPAQQEALAGLFAASTAPGRDAVLKRLVESSAQPVHLICDATHRLLAASPARRAQWRRPLADMLGRSMWRYATAEIEAAEASPEWHRSGALCFRTGANADPDVPIAPGRVLWERLRLEDGSCARLVTALDA